MLRGNTFFFWGQGEDRSVTRCFKQENHWNSNETLKGLRVRTPVHRSSWFVHWDTVCPAWREEQRRKGAGVACSQMLSHCTRFLQLGLTHSVQGMCLFRASQVKEAASEGAWGSQSRMGAEKMCKLKEMQIKTIIRFLKIYRLGKSVLIPYYKGLRNGH